MGKAIVSNFLHHTNCPDCGSSDALGVFDDGHTWCFSCGAYTTSASLSIDNMENILLDKQKERKPTDLPDDFTFNIPNEALAWIKQYSITNQELKDNRIGWSKSGELLIFPYFGEDDEILMWQGRYFPKRNPKVYTCGDCSSCLVLHMVSGTGGGLGDSVVCVVEDPVSALKVGRYVNTTPLFGSHLSIKQAQRIASQFKVMILWLDQDKTKDMIKYAEKYKYFFDDIHIISTELDPKECSDKVIIEELSKISLT